MFRLLATTLMISLMISSWAGANPHAWTDEPVVDPRMQTLHSAVTIRAGGAQGSGTAIGEGFLGTYILTNAHVVRREMDIEVVFYGEDEVHVAYIHSVNREHDIAILITRAEAPALATIGYRPRMFEDVVCVGSPVGTPPAPSVGIVTGLDHSPPNTALILHRSDCNIAPGSSGGGMFAYRNGRWKLVGMPTAGYMQPVGMVGGALVPHLGLMVRMEEIRQHLITNNIPYDQ